MENATVRGRAWYKPLDAPVLTLDVTVLFLAVAHLDQDIWNFEAKHIPKSAGTPPP